MEVSALQISQIASVAERHRLRMVLLFGSAVTGKGEHPRSDLDIAVLYKGKPPGFREHGELSHNLQEIFPGREVDLAVINHADPLFLKKITEECRMLYGNPGRLQELKIYAYKRFQDHRRYFEMERAYADRFLKTMATAE